MKMVCAVLISCLLMSGSIALADTIVNGDLRIQDSGDLVFSDGSVQSKAQVAGPKGDKGDKGDAGSQGAVGPPGITCADGNVLIYKSAGWHCGSIIPVNGGVGICVGGVCSLSGCSKYMTDCDGDLENGCEAQLSSSVNNCGACGNICLVDQICSSGKCIDDPRLIRGVLLDAASGTPIVGAVIDVGVGSATSDANGLFRITNAMTGTLSALINLTMVNVALPAGTTQYPSLSYSQVTNANINKIRIGKLSAAINGAVVNTDGNPVVNANITLKYANVPNHIFAQVNTNAKGEYNFTGVEAGGQYVVLATTSNVEGVSSEVITAPITGSTPYTVDNIILRI